MSAPIAERRRREVPPIREEIPPPGVEPAKTTMEPQQPTTGVPLEPRRLASWAPGRRLGWRQVAAAFMVAGGLLVLLWLLGLFGA